LIPLTGAGVKTGVEGPSKGLVAICVIIVLGCIIINGLVLGYYRWVQKNVADTERQIRAMSAVASKIGQRDRLAREIAAIKIHLDNAEQRQNRITKTLDELSGIMPPAIKLTSLIFESNPSKVDGIDYIYRKFTLQGTGPDHLTVSQFVYQLQNLSMSEGCTIVFSKKMEPLFSEKTEFEVGISSKSPKRGNE